jgi:predicted ATPase/DNA-binding CsgD family transcriptional regulator
MPARQVGAVSLPAQPTVLIGRQRELARIRELLLSSRVRLLTLVGPGGTGKTRLVIAAANALANAFPSGVIFVDLTTAPAAPDVVPTIARALGLRDVDSRVRVDRLARHLSTRELLLVLDNFEHVVGAAPQVAELLTTCPGLKILVTSRAALHLRWEQELPVEPLDVPDASRHPLAASIKAVPSVALFVQRAQSARPDFALSDQNAAAVAAVCRQLDGLPLAIELAAVRTKLLSPQALLQRLDRRLAVLTSGPPESPPRLQTLRSAIAWSYDLLAPAEQALFRQLAVFAGGFSPSLAEAVCRRNDTSGSVLDSLGSLVDKSLLRVREQPDGEPRFSMLDTLREYAGERLDAAAEGDELQERHAQVFLQLAEEAEPHLVSSARDAWLRQLESEYENLRAALTWLLEHHRGRKACRLAGALRWFWDFQGRVGEGSRWLERSLESADARNPSAERLKALLSGGHLAFLLGDEESARRWLEEAVSIAREGNDRLALADGLMYLAFLLVDRDEQKRAQYEDGALAVLYELKDKWWSALALLGTGVIALGRGDRSIAHLRLEESLELWEQLGDAWFTAQALNALGDMARTQADYSRAAELYSRSLALLRQHGITTDGRYSRGIASVLHNLGYIAHHLHDQSQATHRFLEALEIFANQGDHRGAAECLLGMAVALRGAGQLQDAARLFGAGDGLLASIGSTQWPTNITEVQPAHADTRRELGQDAFARAWSEGRALGLDSALRFVREFAAAADAAAPMPPFGVAALTPREREIAALLVRGYSNRQLADALVISEQTAETHVKRILAKLALRSRHQVAELQIPT